MNIVLYWGLPKRDKFLDVTKIFLLKNTLRKLGLLP